MWLEFWQEFETNTASIDVIKWCSICKRRGHYASEHDDWEKIKTEERIKRYKDVA